MLTATYSVFAWNNPRGKGAAVFEDFARLFYQVIELPPQELPVEMPEEQPKGLDT